MRFGKPHPGEPRLIWMYRLPSFPPKAPESTPAFDGDGNMYFGSHDHCFYSLTQERTLRWSFSTELKVYSSPLVSDTGVYVASGNGHLFCFSQQGLCKWVYDMTGYFAAIRNPCRRMFEKALTRIQSYDSYRRHWWYVKCWASPNANSIGDIYIVGFGLGLHVIDGGTGELRWSRDLGSPRFHLAGVTLDCKDNCYVASQRKRLWCFAVDGQLKWRLSTPRGYDAWATPSYDEELKQAYYSVSCGDSKAVVMAIGNTGTIVWKTTVPGGVRGTAAISYEGYVVVGSLNGCLYFLDKKTGAILRYLLISSARMALWTTPSIDPYGNIYLTSKDGNSDGSVLCIDSRMNLVWRKRIGKALSTPVIDARGRMYVGSWTGDMLCYQL